MPVQPNRQVQHSQSLSACISWRQWGNVVTFDKAIASCLRKYATFQGRSSRSEYWYFTLFVVLLRIGTTILDRIAFLQHSGRPTGGIVTALVMLAVLLPHFSVMVRRFHDISRSGWWAAGLVALITLAVWLILFSGLSGPRTIGFLAGVAGFATLMIFLALPSTQGENRFGPNPLNQTV